MKILLLAAMPTESDCIIDYFDMQPSSQLGGFFPSYSTKRGDKDVFLVQTHVGSINASAATALALTKIQPDVSLKVGCIGANSPGFKKNDIVVPRSFFHTGAWITRSHASGEPTSNAAVWQNLYGDEPYQNSKQNLGGLDYSFKPDVMLNDAYKRALRRQNKSYTEAHLGSGDMVIFDHEFMAHIRKSTLHINDKGAQWCTDNESQAIAHVCEIFKVPFTGIYFVASSDYEDIGGYDPDAISAQTRRTILPIISDVIEEL